MRIPNSGIQLDSPAYPLLMAAISYWGITSANGGADGKSFVCADLANHSSLDGHTVKFLTGPAAGPGKTIQVYGATCYVETPFVNAAGAVQQITAGTLFVILTQLGGGSGPGPSPEEGLSYYGIVDAVPGVNQFTVNGLAGLGAGKFAGATNPYQVYVLRDSGGASAAPQGEQQAITAYATATGVFATAAFTAPIAVGDEVLIIAPQIANILVILAGLAVPGVDALANALMRDVVGNKADSATLDDMSLLATSSLVREMKRVLLRMSPDAFTATIQGAARTDLDTMLAQLATYFVAAGAALSVTIDPGGAARTSLAALWNDLGQMMAGAAGITTFPASSPPANGVSFAEVIRYINDLVVAMYTLQETGGTLLADGTEQNVVIVNAPAGVFKPLTIAIDLDNMAGGDTTVIRCYSRITLAGGLQQVDYLSYTGADGGLLNGTKVIYITLPPNRYGFSVTLQQTAGVNRNYGWEYFFES